MNFATQNKNKISELDKSIEMSYRQRMQQRNISNREEIFTPVVGLLDKQATLNCRISGDRNEHKFNCAFSHPLNNISKIFTRRLKEPFRKILSITYDLQVQNEEFYWPHALLDHKSVQINSAYLEHIRNSKINTYIKTHVRHESLSKEKKEPKSQSVPRKSKIIISSNKNHYDYHTEKKSTVQGRVSQHLGVEKHKDIVTTSDDSLKVKFQQRGKKELQETARQLKTHQKESKKSQGDKKGRRELKINVSYTTVKANKRQSHNKTTLQSQEHSKIASSSYLANRTERVYAEDIISSRTRNPEEELRSQREEEEIEINYKPSMKKKNSSHKNITTYNDEILSEQIDNKSLRNSEMSEMTQNDREQSYFHGEKVIKKSRKKVYFEQTTTNNWEHKETVESSNQYAARLQY